MASAAAARFVPWWTPVASPVFEPQGQAILQEILWGQQVGGSLWPFQPLGWDYLRPLHLHGQPEILFLRKGSLTLYLGRQALKMRAGDLAWVPPSVQHITVDQSRDLDYWVLQLEPWLVRRALERTSIFEPGSQPGQWLELMLRRIPDRPLFELDTRQRDTIEQSAALTYQTHLQAWVGHSPLDSPYEWIPPWTTSLLQRAREQLMAVFVASCVTKVSSGRPKSRVPGDGATFPGPGTRFASSRDCAAPTTGSVQPPAELEAGRPRRGRYAK